MDQDDIEVFIGVDVGKSGHHAVALNRAGKRLFDKTLPNDEAKMRGTRRSGTSIHSAHSSRRGNKRLKRALFLSSFASLHDPASRAYYDRKIAQGKKHNQALLALSRRRCDVLFALIRDGALYNPPLPAAA